MEVEAERLSKDEKKEGKRQLERMEGGEVQRRSYPIDLQPGVNTGRTFIDTTAGKIT